MRPQITFFYERIWPSVLFKLRFADNFTLIFDESGEDRQRAAAEIDRCLAFDQELPLGEERERPEGQLPGQSCALLNHRGPIAPSMRLRLRRKSYIEPIGQCEMAFSLCRSNAEAKTA
jgi:hypothetical protein